MLANIEASITTNIKNHISDKLEDLIETKIPKIEQKLNNIEQTTSNVTDNIELISSKQPEQEEVIVNINETVANIEERVNRIVKDKEITDLKIADIENDLDNVHNITKVEENNKIKELEHKVKVMEEKLKETELTNLSVTKNDDDIKETYAMIAKKKTNTNESVFKSDTTVINSDDKSVIWQAKSKIGIYPVMRSHITYFAFSNMNHENDTDNEVFHGSKYEEQRVDAAVEFLTKELKFGNDDVIIKEAKMSTKVDSNIMWVTMTEQKVKETFQRAARVKNSKIKLFTFFPASIWDRKVELDRLCKIQREINPKLRTQIRLGSNDIELYTKEINEPYWLKTPVLEFGPLPPIGYKLKTDQDKVFSPPKERGHVMSGSMNSKRQASSPRENDAKKNRDDLTSSSPSPTPSTSQPVNQIDTSVSGASS